MLTFGGELWDQLPTIDSFTSEGVKFLEDCSTFFKERARLEAEHARSLQKLTNSFLHVDANSSKSVHSSASRDAIASSSAPGSVTANANDAKSDVSSTEQIRGTIPVTTTMTSADAQSQQQQQRRLEHLRMYTLPTAWYTILQQTHRQAQEQELLADELQHSVSKVHKNFFKEKAHERKQLLDEAHQLRDAMRKQYKLLEKSKEKYDKKKRKADVAKMNFERVQRDVNADDAVLSKSNGDLSRRNDKATSAETSYQSQLEECNQAQEDFLSLSFPAALNQLQQLEEARVDHMKDILTRFVALTQQANTSFEQTAQHMLQACDAIDRDHDIQHFIATNRSGEVKPSSIGFQPFNATLGAGTSMGATAIPITNASSTSLGAGASTSHESNHYHHPQQQQQQQQHNHANLSTSEDEEESTADRQFNHHFKNLQTGHGISVTPLHRHELPPLPTQSSSAAATSQNHRHATNSREAPLPAY